MKSFYTIFFILCITIPAFSCINDYVEVESEVVPQSELKAEFVITPFQVGFSQAALKSNLAAYDLKKLGQSDYQETSNLATLYIRLGEFEKARDILEPLAADYPDEYIIIANLGTTYELLGENEKALTYIKKGIQLNPDSHQGSEWVHVKILEAKIKDRSTIFGDLLKQNKHKKNSHAHEKMINKLRQIDYQLHERVPFIPIPHSAGAQLFSELATLTARAASIDNAYIYFSIANIYADGKDEAILKEIKTLKQQIEKREGENVETYFTNNLRISNYFNTTNIVNQNNKVNWQVEGTEKARTNSQNNYTPIMILSGGLLLILLVVGLLRRRKKEQ